jgi:hypothetical protein
MKVPTSEGFAIPGPQLFIDDSAGSDNNGGAWSCGHKRVTLSRGQLPQPLEPEIVYPSVSHHIGTLERFSENAPREATWRTL